MECAFCFKIIPEVKYLEHRKICPGLKRILINLISMRKVREYHDKLIEEFGGSSLNP